MLKILVSEDDNSCFKSTALICLLLFYLHAIYSRSKELLLLSRDFDVEFNALLLAL